MNPNKALWEKGDFTRIAATMRESVVDGSPVMRKLDVRLYTYQARTLIGAARIYQGQTTNLSTPGGGFAPLFIV